MNTRIRSRGRIDCSAGQQQQHQCVQQCVHTATTEQAELAADCCCHGPARREVRKIKGTQWVVVTY